MLRERIGAPAGIKRVATMLATALAASELGLMACAWRLGVLLDPGPDLRARQAFVLLGTVLTLQAMSVVGIAWLMIAWSRTELTVEDDHVVLEHPWRRWSGDAEDIRRASWRRGWLVVRTRDSWRRWYVRVEETHPTLARLRDRLGPNRWR
jgi:hypothetical protein